MIIEKKKFLAVKSIFDSAYHCDGVMNTTKS